MHKKILITLSLLLSLGEAIELEKWFHSVYPEQYGIFDTRIIGVDEGEAIANKDWIAIYKKGASTEWKNVLAWNWVKDLVCTAPADCRDMFYARSLPEGEYEVRYFKNNSYNIETSIDMVVEAHDSFLREIRISKNKGELSIYMAGLTKHVKPGKKDWVAIYKVGTSNEWANVIKWHWVDTLEQGSRGKYWKIKLEELEAGDYEVRYFLNNSYTTYKKKSFKVDNAEEQIKVFRDDLIPVSKGYYIERVRLINPPHNNKDWIAIFKKDAPRIKENIRAWSNNISSNDANIRIWELTNGEYDLVYFLKDSYKQYGKSTRLVVNK